MHKIAYLWLLVWQPVFCFAEFVISIEIVYFIA